MRGLNARGLGEYTRKQIDELTEYAAKIRRQRSGYLAITAEGEQRSSFAKFLSPRISCRTSWLAWTPSRATCCLFVADQPAVVFEALGRLRVLPGDRLGLARPGCAGLLLGDRFPLFEWNEEEQALGSQPSSCSPRPCWRISPCSIPTPVKARGQQYDLVLQRLRGRRRLDPHPRPRHAGEGLPADRAWTRR